MRPRPLVPSSRRTLSSVAVLLISAALSLGFAPLSSGLDLGEGVSALAAADEPCDLEKVSNASADVSKSSFAVATSSPVNTTPADTSVVDSAASNAKAAVSAVKPQLSTASPVGLLQRCEGVRPGALVLSDTVGGCTFNFVFTDGRRNYIGTAGHCVFPGSSVRAGGGPGLEQTWAVGTGPIARDAAGNKIGEFAYGIYRDTHDFALIRLDGGVQFNPAMCHFGGPTGINAERTGAGELLHYYGNAMAISTLAPARSAIATDMSDPNVVSALGVAVFGDSGAGVIDSDGRAVGLIAGAEFLPRQRPISIPRIAPQIALAEKALGLKIGSLRLVTAPLE